MSWSPPSRRWRTAGDRRAVPVFFLPTLHCFGARGWWVSLRSTHVTDSTRDGRASEIRRRCPHQAFIVAIETEPHVARRAQKATHLAGRMTMIDTKAPGRLFPADCARTALLRQQGFIILYGHSVPPEPSRASAPPVVGKHFRPISAVGGVSVPTTCVDLLFVRLIEGVVVCAQGLSKFRILRESFASSLSPLLSLPPRTHRFAAPAVNDRLLRAPVSSANFARKRSPRRVGSCPAPPSGRT
jgi:hypothetical protein